MPEQEEPKITYSKFRGKYNLNDAYRVKPTEEGIYLASSNNCFADKIGGILSREGFLSRDSNSYHSVKSFGQNILGVVNGNLCRIFISGNTVTSSVLVYNVGSTRFNWKKVGAKIFGTNESIFGYFNTFDNSWTSLLSTSETYKRIMPSGHLIEWVNGRLLVATGKHIVISDPYSYHTYDTRSDKSYIKLKSRVNMLAGVKDGFWTSDKEGIYFIKGTKPAEYERIPVVGYRVFENNYAVEEGIFANKEYYENCIFMTTSKGICIGGNSGKFTNLTELNYEMSNSSEGIGFLRRGTYNQYISISK